MVRSGVTLVLLCGVAVSGLVACGSSQESSVATAEPAATSAPTEPAVATATGTTSTTAMPSTSLSQGYSSGFDPDVVALPTVIGPWQGGKGVPSVGASGDVSPFGYVEEEFVLSGTAHALQVQGPLAPDGRWDMGSGSGPDLSAEYTTRIVVRRPADASRATGDVMVEWMNVTAGFDNPVVWAYAAPEITRSGWTYVGVSAQQVGIEGGGAAIVDLSLKTADPDRYASLSHPGDAWSYDIFSQAGAAVRVNWETVLGGIRPEHVVAVGESQSAYRLATYLNAVAPTARVFDGYLVHSRGASGAQISQAPLPEVKAPDPLLLRDDLAVPVLTVVAETDVVSDGLGFGRARQGDTDLRRTWEMAGTSHADSYQLSLARDDDGSAVTDELLFRSMVEPTAEVYGGIISCDRPFNSGPHTYVLRAAIRSLATWVRSGVAPPLMSPIDLDDDGLPVFDETGNAVGGVRTPHVDAPVAVLSGRGQTGESFCGLFGTTEPLAPDALAARYGDRAGFLTAWRTATDDAVAAGAILPEDAERLVAAAEAVTGEIAILPG